MKIVHPAITMMNRLSYPQKFILISFLFALPLTLIMYLLLSEINSRIDFAQKEIDGNEYLRPLRQLRESVIESELLNYRRWNYQLQTGDEPERVEAQIKASLQTLEAVDRKLGDSLNSTKKLQEIKQDWQNFQQLRRDWSIETYDVFYQKFLSDINRLSAHVGDTSNLILDPDLDTYYLMDATLLKLPEIQKTLAQIRLISEKVNTRSASAEDRAQLIMLSGNLREIQTDLERNLEVAFSNNPAQNLRPKLTEKSVRFSQSIKKLIQKLDRLIYTSAMLENSSYLNCANETLDLSFKCWDQLIEQLDFLLQRRIAGFVSKQIAILIYVALILAIVIYLFTGFYLAVMKTVYILDKASKKMAKGRQRTKIVLDNKDELGRVVGSFNNIAEALIKANTEITLLNERLKAENVRMSAELDITRKIQHMLLPKEHELKQFSELEIAGFMEPAAEVGGDYYDIIQHEGRIKIGIGDVTGHGLESGVLMIMVQAAVRALLANNETDPVKFLSALNRAIYDNVQRMKTDKNLTLALLDYQGGVLKLSGQHEEMIVVRKNGKAERINTIDLGFPIGLEENITDFISQAKVKLESGDIAVLYTDGITEAENIHRTLYGVERLINIIQKNSRCSAKEIRQAVIEDVWQYIGEQKVYDDITLIVLKQK